jgi:hypothetical protein
VIHEPTGEVLFNYKYPALAPDVILSHEDEQIKFDPNIDHLKVSSVLLLLPLIACGNH